MSGRDREIYLKFKIDKSGHGMMNALLVSEDLDTINTWDCTKREETENDNVISNQAPGVFQKVSRDFLSEISVYQNSVPFIMSTLPFIGQMVDNQQIRGFAKKNGNCLEAGEFEVYEFSMDFIPRLKRILDRTYSIKNGIDQIPKLFFLGLISTYDAFLSELIRAILVTKPEMLSSSEKNISFKDLLSMGSVDAARDFLIEKEIESVIRQSHHDQVKWLENKLNITLTKDLDIFPEFIEICERRNLFTHTKGVVSSQYCNVCADFNVKSTAKVGELLSVNPKYFKRSIAVIFEMGVKLTQVIWRKLVPDEIDRAAIELNNIAYELIAKRDYKSADALLYFGLEVMKRYGSDATKKMMIINRANSLKLGGDKEGGLAVISKEDWSASTDDYKICVAAVKDDIPAVIDLMKRVVETRQMDANDMREWPVFEKARADERFVEAFETTFGEKLLRDKETATRPAAVNADDNGDPESSNGLLVSENDTRH